MEALASVSRLVNAVVSSCGCTRHTVAQLPYGHGCLLCRDTAMQLAACCKEGLGQQFPMIDAGHGPRIDCACVGEKRLDIDKELGRSESG